MSSPSTSAQRKRLNRADREATLLDAAAKIVADEGAEALTMEGLAAQAGVNKALVYRFFANRDAALVALWDRETNAFDERIAEAIADEDTLEGRLRAIVDVWMDDVEAGGGLIGRLEALGVGPPELETRRRQRTEGIVNFLAGLIRDEVSISPENAITAAAVLGAGSQGLMALRAHTGWSRRRLGNAFIRLCMGAIAALER